MTLSAHDTNFNQKAIPDDRRNVQRGDRPVGKGKHPYILDREEWGAKEWTRTPTELKPENRKGVTFHWIGGPCTQPESHDSGVCDQMVRNVQSWHQDGNDWSDIAYSFVICRHRFIYRARGWVNDQFANWPGAQDWITVLFLIGGNEDGTSDQSPTEEMKNAAKKIVELARKKGAGKAVVPHNFLTPKACPGNEIEQYAASLNNRSL